MYVGAHLLACVCIGTDVCVYVCIYIYALTEISVNVQPKNATKNGL